MSILRLLTLSLTLAMAVVALGVSADGWAAAGVCSGPKADPNFGDFRDARMSALEKSGH